jgi:hypothetical protein
VRTAPPISENYSIVFLPLHPETSKEQTRVQVLRFATGEQLSSLRDQELDWELLAATPPFGGLQELAKGNARDLEAGVAWLLWMIGFSAAHLGSTTRTQDAADLIVTSPAGHFAVVECTTGLLRTDNKLPTLVARATEVRKRLDSGNNRHLAVISWA